jgi:hypothetical protein
MACFLYIDESTRDEGRKALQKLTIEYIENDKWDKSNSAHYFVDRMKDKKKIHIFRSYAKGELKYIKKRNVP